MMRVFRETTTPAPSGAARIAPRATIVWRSRHGASERAFRVLGAWGIHLYPYSAELSRDGGPWRRIEPGMAGLTPPGASMRYRWPRGAEHVFAHVVWPDGAPDFLAARAELFPCGARFPALWERLAEAIPWVASNPERADARVWDVWCEILELARGDEGRRPDAVERAVAIVERDLAIRIEIAAVAREAGLSGAHLTRLFRRHLGETVVGHVARRRAERAAELLRGTDLPCEAIARMVGVADAQALNKLVRKNLGRSPRALREECSVPIVVVSGT